MEFNHREIKDQLLVVEDRFKLLVELVDRLVIKKTNIYDDVNLN